MPGAVAFLAFGTTSVTGLTFLGVGIGAGTIGGAVLSAVGSLLLSTAANALLGSKTPSVEAQEFRGISKSATGKRLVPIGRLQIGGTLASEPRIHDGKLYILIAHCVGPINDREKHLVDGREVTLDANGFAIEDKFKHNGDSKLQILTRVGDVPSVAYDELIAAFPDWTADHRLDGLASTLMILHPSPNAPAMFPRLADTQYSPVIKGLSLRDPRTGTSAWSQNPALAILDYFENRYGLSATEINDASFITSADLCDASRLAPSGSSESYKVGGAYALDENPKTVIQSFLNACDGRLTFNSQGQVGLEVGGDTTATVTLAKKNVKGVMSWQRGKPLLQAYNVLNATYTDQSLGFVSQATEPLVSAAGVARLGRRKDESIDLTLVPDWETATYLKHDRLIRDNPRELGRIRYDLSGLAAIGQRYVYIDVDITPTRSITAKVEVLNVEIDNPLTYVDLDVALLDDGLHGLQVTGYGNPPVASLPDDEGAKPKPTGFTAVPSGYKTSANAFSAGIFTTWDASPYSSLLPVLQYSEAGTAAWQTVITSEGAISARVTGLTEGQAYDLRLAFTTTQGSLDDADFVTIDNVVAAASTTTPIAPTLFTATDQAGGSAVVMLTSSASADLWRTNIYRDGVLILSQPSDPSVVLTFTDAPGAGSYVYTAESENFSGGKSTPQTATMPTTTIIT